MTRILRICIFCLALLFLLAGTDLSASTGLSIQPIKIIHTLSASEAVQGAITLTNAGDEMVNVFVSVEDFIPVADTSSIQFVGRAEGVTTVRDWVTLDSPENFTFKPGETRSIGYTIRAPGDAEPGGHYGVAFFKATKIDDQGSVRVGTRVGATIFVTVPGNRQQEGEILGFSAPKFVQHGPIEFILDFKNTGTVHFEPKGAITIKNIFGKEVGIVSIGGQVVLPDGRKELRQHWLISGPLFGRYSASASIIDGDGNELTTKTIAFYAFPIWYVLIFIGLALIVFVFLRYIKGKIKISVSINQA